MKYISPYVCHYLMLISLNFSLPQSAIHFPPITAQVELNHCYHYFDQTDIDKIQNPIQTKKKY